jgi:uncharacterized protein (TIGR02099 family)
MMNLLRRVAKFFAYFAAGVVILLAIVVGLFRLFLPRLPEYQEEIKIWASTEIGVSVEFTGMDARWGLSGPELKFYNAELLRQDTMVRLVAAEEVSIGVSLVRFIVDGTLQVDRVVVRETSIEVRQLENEQWMIQGSLIDDLREMQQGTGREIGEIEFLGQNIELLLLQPGDQRPKRIDIGRLQVRSDSVRLAVDASLNLPRELGGRVTLAATQLLAPPVEERSWDVDIEAGELRLAGLSQLHEARAAQFVSGSGSIDLSLEYAGGEIESATADFSFEEILHEKGEPFDVAGRLEFSQDNVGWLLAADDLRLTTPSGSWPESSFHVETSVGRDGQIIMLNVRASHINLSDGALLEPWLTEQQNTLRSQLDLSGVVRDLNATLSDIDTDTLRYDVAVDLDKVGISAYEKFPGVRGFSGNLRADRAGGLLAISAEDMSISIPDYLAQNITLDAAAGTVIWRRSGNRTTFLSDHIEISNSIIESDTNVELTFLDGGGAPVIDLDSTWSVSDISAARQYLPQKIMKPKLYDWLNQALVGGRIPRGKTRLYGPLDKFPFDNDEGRLLIDANIRDATLLYHTQWPAAELINLEVGLENLRLYSKRSRTINAGNEVIDAKVEIGDFRTPVLTVEGFATGQLETIRQFAMQSPIGLFFGGQLERVTVGGDASFDLSLTVPLQDWENFDFSTRIQSNNGSVQIEGFQPPVIDLNGFVMIDRESITSEALSGQFLGRPIAIELQPAPDSMPGYRLMANATGVATATGLSEGFDIPLDSYLKGETPYAADLYFPRSRQEEPAPFRIEIESELTGIAVSLPAPLGKAADEAIHLASTIELLAEDNAIAAAGTAGELLAWSSTFVKLDDHWDFDRGVLTIGGDPITPAETRGLHIRGNTEYFRLREWLDLSKSDNAEFGLVDRIRSIQLNIDSLYLLGQHVVDHNVRLDRSGEDWSVQIEGDNFSGSAVIPYEFTAERVLTLDMERLLLPGDDTAADDEVARDVDPRSLPSISLKASEFALGDRYLGVVEATFQRTEAGLVTTDLLATDATFTISGEASWLADAADPSGYRSAISASLASTDIEATMQRLAYEPGIEGDQLSIDFGLSWSGGPREDFMDSLDGDVKVAFGAGQLVEVEPGAGRVFGLMSVGALPRRLSLDFSDVFTKGFGFDEIKGDFRLDSGDAYTCNLSLAGPAADIGIVGYANLVDREYGQTAVVSANVGNTLPIVGAVIAGPQVAAALLIFSQIFKKPLQDMGQVYYTIDGSWDEPTVDSTNAQNFAERGRNAGCIAK